jgi:hypothetical protein
MTADSRQSHSAFRPAPGWRIIFHSHRWTDRAALILRIVSAMHGHHIFDRNGRRSCVPSRSAAARNRRECLGGVRRRSVAVQFTATKGICTCPSGMNLSTVSNKTWPSVEETLNSWNRAKCSIASAGAVAHGSTQPNRKSIGIKKRLACTMVSYANFARNMEDSHTQGPEIRSALT